VLHDERFCVKPDTVHGAADGGTVVTLPLCARGDDLIEAVAVIRLPPAVRITELAAQLIERIAEPLQVALEREVSYRRLDIARERAYRRSIRDPLTGLFTRFYMQDVLARQCALHGRDPSATLSVCLLDIDHFKQVNDTHGHLAGDRVLAGLAALLQHNCRDTDILVRYGGEEILVASIGQDIAGAAQLAERLQDMIARTPIAIDESGQEQLRVTVSIGVAEHRQGETLEAAIQRADRALYEAKEQGRNRVRLEPLAAPDGVPRGQWAAPEGG
jgi:diguanylate cyclase (GGDEF)-like protein